MGNNVIDKNVLDLFAGTGNLGIEALSRGAKHATFVDYATDKIIAQNLQKTHLSEKGEIFKGDVLKILEILQKRNKIYNLIFLDPPYYKGLSHKALEFLNSSILFSDNGIIVVEYGIDEEFPVFDKIESIRTVSYGKTTKISFFERKENK